MSFKHITKSRFYQRRQWRGHRWKCKCRSLMNGKMSDSAGGTLPIPRWN